MFAYEDNSADMSIAEQLNHKLIINTEFTNIQEDPHLSIWTPVLAREYIESEGTFDIISIEPNFTFANRDIYMKIECKRK